MGPMIRIKHDVIFRRRLLGGGTRRTPNDYGVWSSSSKCGTGGAVCYLYDCLVFFCNKYVQICYKSHLNYSSYNYCCILCVFLDFIIVNPSENMRPMIMLSRSNVNKYFVILTQFLI